MSRSFILSNHINILEIYVKSVKHSKQNIGKPIRHVLDVHSNQYVQNLIVNGN